MGLAASLASEFGMKDVSSFARAISQLGSLIYSATVLSSAILSIIVEHGMEYNRDWPVTAVGLPYFVMRDV